MKISNIKTSIYLNSNLKGTVAQYDSLELDHIDLNIPINNSASKAKITSVYCALDIIVRRIVYRFDNETTGRLFQIGNIEDLLSEPALVVWTTRTGRIIVKNLVAEQEFILSATDCLIQHSGNLKSHITLDTSGDIETFVLIIGDSTLFKLLGKLDALEFLKQLRIDNVTEISQQQVPLSISNILHSSMPEDFTGNMVKLFAQSKILEYLCNLVKYVSIVKMPTADRSTEKAIRQILIDYIDFEGKLPTVDLLASAYGMSVSTLNEEFKRLHGRSVIGCLILLCYIINSCNSLLLLK